MAVMIVDPPAFKCRVHGHDLTERVKLALDLDDRDLPPIAYPRRRERQRTGDRFQVQVTCPGTGEPHTVICSGVKR